MGDKIELKSIKELLGMKFFIPNYQRGYRWKEKQVQQLLEDIDTFVPTEKNPFYFLQALAVAKNEDKFNVVDGQQRLTTISLILNNENQEWISYDRLADNSIDRHYKNQAKETIDSFLGKADVESNKRRQEFCDKIKDKCKFLWYEVAPDKELSTFNDLNSGKIPAKDSELVKCILLSKGSDEPIVVTQARAMEWDAIEREMNNDNFFAWMTPRNVWKEDDRMTVLFRYSGFCPDEKTEEVFPFLTEIQSTIQEGKSRETIWKQICSAYYHLIAWYNDSLMYHAFGAYVHRRGNEKCMPLSDIKSKLEEIANYDLSGDDVFNVNDTEKKKLHRYLLLANCAYCWKRWPMRYDFKQHRKIGTWSIEHIFARNQKNLSEEDFKSWNIPADRFEDYKKDCDANKGNEWLKKVLGERYPSENEDNSLKNMALLSRDANSVLNNKLFDGKRNEIMGWAENHWEKYWVPSMTEAVFMKSLLGVSMDPFFSEKDKEAYLAEMKNSIKEFINALKNY